MKNTDIQVLVGAKLRYLRKIKGLSQKEAAERVGVTDVYWGAVERGSRNLSVQSLSKLASALEVTVWELFRFEELEIDTEIHEKRQVAQIAHSLLLTRSLGESKMALDVLRRIFETFDNEKKIK
ncbi:helix-turn-helix domain-containing protein [Paenibacillus rhizophilus]|uniref:helix-turn-helix domain-containing protein n=1 Tax=Paenibacillus rhizophilus TaxID=1850366 RepID=UPI00163AAF1C|nr:helix-turn-helix transcriptional regulator [Paenibacillus rhizophilus]